MANPRTSPSSKRNIKPLPVSASSSSAAQQQSGRSETLLPPISPSGPAAISQPGPESQLLSPTTTTSTSPVNPRKRRASGQKLAPTQLGQNTLAPAPSQNMAAPQYGDKPTSAKGFAPMAAPATSPSSSSFQPQPSSAPPPAKKGRTNTPWTPAEEQRLKQMRDLGNSWSEIAKTFPNRTEGSVKKHWYKDMHYAEFAENESAALLAAIKEYEANKWRVIGTKLGKPAKACEQYAKEHFGSSSK